MLLKDKVALVTGASRGIGAATARLLAQHGAKVAVNYLSNQTAALQVVHDIQVDGGKAYAVQADVTVKGDVERMVREAQDALGPVDVLVLNASISFRVAPFVEYTWEDFEPKLNGELKAAFHCCKAVVPSMIERRRGCIIAVSSGLSRRPGDGFCAHTTAKSGLDGFCKALAHEIGPQGIRVNVVAPGLTETDATSWIPEAHKQMMASIIPLRRNGTPEDVAGAVLMLASDAAQYITGAYLSAGGGGLML